MNNTFNDLCEIKHFVLQTRVEPLQAIDPYIKHIYTYSIILLRFSQKVTSCV